MTKGSADCSIRRRWADGQGGEVGIKCDEAYLYPAATSSRRCPPLRQRRIGLNRFCTHSPAFPTPLTGCAWFDDNLNSNRDEGTMARQVDLLYNRVALPPTRT